MLVIAHDDWDGVVSALFLRPGAELRPAHYDELDVVHRETRPPRLFTEVHSPHSLLPGDVLVDHHTPAIASVPAHGLTGYVVVVGEEWRVVLVSPSAGRDYSNVRAVRSMYGLLPPPLSDTAVKPAEDIARLSDVLDNPLLARTEEERSVVLGYDAAWDYVRGYLLLRRPGPDEVDGVVRRALHVFYRVSRLVEKHVRLPGGTGPLLIVSRGAGWYAKLLVKLAQYTQDRPLYAVAEAWRGGLRRLLLVTPDSTALSIARELGGGGRPIPGGGTVAGATAPLQEILRAIGAVAGQLQIVHAEPPRSLEEEIRREVLRELEGDIR